MSHIPDLNEFEYKERLAAEFSRRTDYDSFRNQYWYNRLIELASLRRGHRVLDIATGTGLVAIAAAPAVHSRQVVALWSCWGGVLLRQGSQNRLTWRFIN